MKTLKLTDMFPEQLELPKSIIKNALLTGHRLTTAQANFLGTTVDSRKCISRLRSEGLPIDDKWEVTDGRRYKIYFFNPQQTDKQF